MVIIGTVGVVGREEMEKESQERILACFETQVMHIFTGFWARNFIVDAPFWDCRLPRTLGFV